MKRFTVLRKIPSGDIEFGSRWTNEEAQVLWGQYNVTDDVVIQQEELRFCRGFACRTLRWFPTGHGLLCRGCRMMGVYRELDAEERLDEACIQASLAAYVKAHCPNPQTALRTRPILEWFFIGPFHVMSAWDYIGGPPKGEGRST